MLSHGEDSNTVAGQTTYSRTYEQAAFGMSLIIVLTISMFEVQVCLVAGADAAFHVLADAGRWQQAVHLAVACLASNCSQSSQLLVYSH